MARAADMRKHVAGQALVLVAILSAWSCSTLTHVVWPATVTCGAPVVGALVDDIKNIIVNGGTGGDLGADAIAALEALAAKNGPELVACILGQLIGSWLPASGVAASSSAADYASRAQGFLNDHQVTVRE